MCWCCVCVLCGMWGRGIDAGIHVGVVDVDVDNQG